MMKNSLFALCLGAVTGLTAQVVPNGEAYTFNATQNPIIAHMHTADPAPFVKGDTSEETLWKMARRIEYSMPGQKTGCAFPISVEDVVNIYKLSL